MYANLVSKFFVYKGVDKYLQIARKNPETCSTCIYYNSGICHFLDAKYDTKTMIINKDLCGPYHKFHKKEE